MQHLRDTKISQFIEWFVVAKRVCELKDVLCLNIAV